MMLATLIQPRASSSATRQYSNAPSPRPPYSSGIRMAKKPSSPICSISSRGMSPLTGSSRLAVGSTTSRTKSRATSRIMIRSGVRYPELAVGEASSAMTLALFRSPPRKRGSRLFQSRRMSHGKHGKHGRSDQTPARSCPCFPCFPWQKAWVPAFAGKSGGSALHPDQFGFAHGVHDDADRGGVDHSAVDVDRAQALGQRLVVGGGQFAGAADFLGVG